MKTKLTSDQQPSLDWVEQAVRAHVHGRAKPVPPASPEFLARCQAAAQAALDVEKMQAQRPHLWTQPGSLFDHFDELAARAAVKLENIFATCRIDRKDLRASAPGLARLARNLGLNCNETVLRMRWVVAQTTGFEMKQAAAVRSRRMNSAKPTANAAEEALLAAEKRYTPTQRAELRAALEAVARAFAGDAE